MNRQKKYSILTLAVVLMAALVAAFSLLFGVTAADARTVTLTGSNYFYTANSASIDEYITGTETDDDGEETDVYYTMFTFSSEDDAITYRKNLAYHWYASDDEAEDGYTEGFLNTTIGFTTTDAGTLPFATFTIRFQSQQYSETKDGVTTNYVKFVANSEGTGVYVLIGDEDAVEAETYADIEDYEELVYLTDVSSITISFTGYASGVYTVEVADGTNAVTGEFANVGGTYSQFASSSSSTSVIPLTYSATLADEDSDETVGMILYDFNGQSFKLSGSGGYVTDDTPPVLCLDEVVTTLRYGYAVDVEYTAIDMLATSPRSTLYYYVLTNAQVEEEDYDFNDYENDEFIEITSDDEAVVIRDNDAYTARNDGDTDSLAYAKVYIRITDSTSSGSSDYICLDWYVDDSYLAEIEGATNTAKFLRAVTDEEGATYSYDGATDVDEDGTISYSDVVSSIATEYQAMVDAALEEQEAHAGDGNYFYLPSFEEFVTDNYTDYTSLSFSIYYIENSTSASSSTSLAYNELALEIDTRGDYKFAIYVTDSESNEMWCYDEDGNVITITASDIEELLEDPANSDFYGLVPIFSFNVQYTGVEVEDSGAQDIAYVDSEYTASSFDVTGLSSNYEVTYNLYVFDLAAFVEANGVTLTYAQFLNIVEDLFNNNTENYVFINEQGHTTNSTRSYFTTIKALDDMEETDEDYDDYADYEWDPDSLSFVPQDDNTFYVIVLTVTDKTLHTESVTSYMSISVSAAAESLKGESEWLENNIASIVLLCIAGAALIGIVLLVVIKPREKGDIDIIDENDEKGAKGKRKNKKSKKAE